ncbi:hypothetical protein ACLB2K_067338 [Fragaria x ananassa]
MADKSPICKNRGVALPLRVHALMVPKAQSLGFREMAAAYFWDTSNNTFNFIFGQMGITLLDLYVITGLPVFNKPYQEIDFEEEAVAFEANPNRLNFCNRAPLDTRPLATDLLCSVQESPNHRFSR